MTHLRIMQYKSCGFVMILTTTFKKLNNPVITACFFLEQLDIAELRKVLVLKI
jgi:hypothetical protein